MPPCKISWDLRYPRKYLKKCPDPLRQTESKGSEHETNLANQNSKNHFSSKSRCLSIDLKWGKFHACMTYSISHPSMGVPWDWFKSPESMEHSWERFKSLQPRWLKWPSVLLYPTSLGTIISQVTKQPASVTSDHWSMSLLITNSDKIVPWVMLHTLFSWDHIKWKNAPVIRVSPCQLSCL